ncbi:hypothetical protein [Herbiconiux liukaitaii]|uniref:hypothetical protein n=1 Tax=Herbiconiux liukaitaii TaxID=3342799 RepID=UPI0035B96549
MGERFRVWALPVGIAVLVPVLAISLWPPPAQSATVAVQIDAAESALSHEVAAHGMLRSAVGADYKGRAFRVTTLEITLGERRANGGAETGDLSASFTTAGGMDVLCEPTSPFEASVGVQTLQCMPFVELDQLAAVTDVRVST